MSGRRRGRPERSGDDRRARDASGAAPGRERGGAPRRLADVLTPALEHMASSDQARAYVAWARAAGDQVASGAHPRYFSRGVLTVECTSSVWANELTYLGGQLLARMDEVAPGHPVKRFRFVVAGGPARQEDTPAAANTEKRNERPAPGALNKARAQAEDVRDQRLRAAIEAALRGSSEPPPAGPGESTPDG